MSRQFLRDTQNSDGGWAYFAGKHSWLEPTIYAALALNGEPAGDRAFAFVRSCALADGGWRMSADVATANWTTALCVTLYLVKSVQDDAFRKGVRWMLNTVGAEGSFLGRIATLLHPDQVDIDASLQGWPWRPDNSSWVEPTAHALVALKKIEKHGVAVPNLLSLRARVETGEKMLIDRRCGDGGWNYGNKRVWNTPLPSYPETTALALLGLQGRPASELTQSLGAGARWIRETPSPLAKAWLGISLRNWGLIVEPAEVEPSGDIMLSALQALAEPDGGHQLLSPGGKV
jgi:hypothetical protein